MRANGTIITSTGRVAAVALCAGVIVIPMFGGGATPVGIAVARLSALAVVLVLVLGRRFAVRSTPLGKPVAALLLVALLGLAQSAAWPRQWVAWVAPELVGLADAAASALGQEPPARVRLTLDPRASRRVALDCLVFAGLAAAAFHLGRRGSRRLGLAAAVLGAAALQIVVGLRPWLAGRVPRLRGAYANPDHLCILLEIASCVAFAGVLWALSTRRLNDRPAYRPVWALAAGTVLVLMLSAISFTGSRAALLAVLVGLVVQALVSRGRSPVVALALAGGSMLFATAYLTWIGPGRTFGRLASTSWFEVLQGERSVVWRESLELFRTFPWTGTGLGTFDNAFPLVQGLSLEGTRWAKAHNASLELLVTGGAVGLAIAAAGVAWLLIALARALRGASRSDERLALAAACGSLAAVAVHETFDFGLSLPANGFVLISVVAAALGARSGARG